MSNDNEHPSYPPRIRKLLLPRSDNSILSPSFPSPIPVQYAPNVAAIPVGVPNPESAPSSPRSEDERARRNLVRETSVPEIDTLSPPPSRSKTDSGRRVENTSYRESNERSGYHNDQDENPGGRKGKGKETSTGAHVRFHPYPHGASRGVQFSSGVEPDYREGRSTLYAVSPPTASRRSPPVYEETDSDVGPSSPGPGPFRGVPSQAEESDDDKSDGSDIDQLASDSDEDRPIPPSRLSGAAGSTRPLPSSWRYGEGPSAGARPQRRNPSKERRTPPEDRNFPRPPPHRYQYGEGSSGGRPRRHDPGEDERISSGESSSARPSPQSWQYGYSDGSSVARPQRHDAGEKQALRQPIPSSLERYPPPRTHIEGPFVPRYDPREELPTRRLMDPRPLENVSNPHWTPYSPGRTQFPLSPAKFSTPTSQPARPIQVTIPERGPDPPEPFGPMEAPPGLKFIIPPHAILTRRSPPPPSLPSDIETEAVLRNVTGLPVPMPLNLTSLRDATNRRELPKLSMLMALAIWGSPTHMLTLSGIISAIEARFPFMQTDDSWKRTIRHKLSFVSAFVRAGKHNEGWVLDVRKSFAGRGAKRLAELRAAARM
ncbi:hypothetical protein D9619_012779 [Psilocybe cf. subviscida]|uniref:Fork-head domain-containing protein n=1 Tax=Psilocybe cf. subviscida TaxID=2480587 RepID=A0A8H5AQW6_9AGAR|nr:hypothetical protein D9619_012779 [Psilocybe cf. subviscida]